MSNNMDWTRHATKKSKKSDDRRLSLPVTNELQKAIEFFKSRNPELDFSDTAVLITFIEAGVRSFLDNLNTPTPVHSDDN
jgi:hypothetical protein